MPTCALQQDACRANVVATMQIIGDVNVKDKNVVIIDDMVDTAGTITKAADIMKKAGAKTVRACASHCVMSGPASRTRAGFGSQKSFSQIPSYSPQCKGQKTTVGCRHVCRDNPSCSG